MGGERPIEISPTGPTLRQQRGSAHQDSRRAEATLRATDLGEGLRQRLADLQALERGHRSALHSRRRRDAGNPGVTVDEHGAAAALALWGTTVLGAVDAQPLPQHGEERLTRSNRDHDIIAVAGKGELDERRLVGDGAIGHRHLLAGE